MTIYEGDTWEENPYELSCQTGIITGEKCNHKGLVEKEKIVLSDYKTKVSGEMEERFSIFYYLLHSLRHVSSMLPYSDCHQPRRYIYRGGNACIDDRERVSHRYFVISIVFKIWTDFPHLLPPDLR